MRLAALDTATEVSPAPVPSPAGQPGATYSVLTASGAYFTTNLLLIFAGLISMPIMTRLLSVADYGLLNLIFPTVSMLVVMASLGFGEAAIRLYGESRSHESPPHQLCDSLLGGTLAMSTLVAGAFTLFALASRLPAAPGERRALLLAALLVIVRAVSGVLYQIYRAQERATAHGVTQVAVRYATTVAAVILLLLHHRAAYVVIFATLLVEATAVAVRIADLRRRGILTHPRLAPPILRAATTYGLPLALASVARALLDYGDRFVIEHALGLDAVATYSVADDVAQKLAEGVLGPLQLAAVPIVFRLWATSGPAETERFATRLFSYIAALAIPIALLYWQLSDALIVLLASDAYRGASLLTPYLLPGVMLGAMNFIAAVGLTLDKRTGRLALNVCLAAFLNLVLNLLLVPRYGLAAAAGSTSVGFAVLFFANYAASGPTFRLHVDARILSKALLASAAMMLAVRLTVPSQIPQALALALRGGVGIAVLIASFTVLDREARAWLSRLWGPADLETPR